MRISTIHEFILLAEKLNYTEAAAQLYISQPTLSKHISDLEAELGVSLLYRDKHGVLLTEAGKIVCDHFKVIQDTILSMEKQLTDHRLALSGYLRCGFLYYFIDEYVNPILNLLNRTIPSFKPQLSYYQPLPLITALEKGEVDLVVTYHYQYDNAGEFVFNDFSEEEGLLFTGTAHPLREKGSVSLSELKDETFVCVHSRPYTNHVLKILKGAGIENPKITFCDQIDALDYILNQTRGVSIMPSSVRNMGRKELYSVPIEEPAPFFPVSVVYKKGNPSPLIPDIVKQIRSKYKL